MGIIDAVHEILDGEKPTEIKEIGIKYPFEKVEKEEKEVTLTVDLEEDTQNEEYIEKESRAKRSIRYSLCATYSHFYSNILMLMLTITIIWMVVFVILIVFDLEDIPNTIMFAFGFVIAMISVIIHAKIQRTVLGEKSVD